MTDSPAYRPPKVWETSRPAGGQWSGINRPEAGPTHDGQLPCGSHPIQLYSLGTPNGMKVTILLEELLAKESGCPGAEYDAWHVDIEQDEQFSTGFLAVNPNGKIPAMVDHGDGKPVRIFESGAILLYLADKFHHFLPTDNTARAECLSWLFWQVGSAPYLGGGFGHFYRYAPHPMEYPIDRYTMEVKRQLDVLDRNLANRRFICGEEYTIADIAIWPWYGRLVIDSEFENVYRAGEFLGSACYSHLNRWAKEIHDRFAVKRGVRVNRNPRKAYWALRERHHANDFEGQIT